MTPDNSLEEPETVTIPFTDFSPRAVITLVGSSFAAAALLLVASVAFPLAVRRYLAGGLLLLCIALLAHWCLFRISHSQLDFSHKKLLRFFVVSRLFRPREFDLVGFDTVRSELNVGQWGVKWIGVSLCSRAKTIELCRFGYEDVVRNEFGYDHPKAKQLRKTLSQKLNLRDVGVV